MLNKQFLAGFFLTCCLCVVTAQTQATDGVTADVTQDGLPVLSDEQRKEQIMDVIRNKVSSNLCRQRMLALLNRYMCPSQFCLEVETYEGFYNRFGCKEDYAKLHDATCAPDNPPCSAASISAETSTKSTITQTTRRPDQVQRDEIKCVMENQLSSVGCRITVRGQSSDDSDIKQGCSTLENFYTLVLRIGCTYDDYDKLHAVICTWDGTTLCLENTKKQRENIAKIVDTEVNPTCKASVNNTLKTDNLFDYCANLTKAKDGLIGNNICTASEVDKLESATCCVGEACFEQAVDMNTREGQVIAAVRKISLRCRKILLFVTTELSQPPGQACKALNSTKQALYGTGVCSAKDYSDLEKVVCNPFKPVCTQCTTPDPFANESAQRALIRDTITNLEKGDCRDFMQEQAKNQISDPLEKTCKVFLDNRPFIVIGEMCSAEQYDQLKGVICGKAGAVFANLAMIIIVCLFAIIEVMS